MMSLFISILASIVSQIHSYPDYVPSLACMEMFPVAHGVDAMNANAASSTPPYVLTVNTTTYEPGDVIEIFLNSTQSGSEEFAFYEGVYIEARRADCNHAMYTEAVGTFLLDENEEFLETAECNEQPDKVIRHMAHKHVYNSTFYWKAPSTSVGHIYFRGTVARRKTTFWTNVNSEFIQEFNSSSPLSSGYCQTRTNYIGCPEVKPPGVAASNMAANFFLLINVVVLGSLFM